MGAHADSGPKKFEFEPAPGLPGSDRLSKIMFSGIRRLTNRLWDFTVEGSENVPVDVVWPRPAPT